MALASIRENRQKRDKGKAAGQLSIVAALGKLPKASFNNKNRLFIFD